MRLYGFLFLPWFSMRRFALLMALAAATGAATAQPRGDSLGVVVRVDDIQSRSTILPRGLGPFEAVLEARGAKATWLVIPNRLIEAQNTTGALAGVLAGELRASAARGHEVALHGYTHICARCGLTDHEMWCRRDRVAYSEAVQTDLIDRGLAVLRQQIGTDVVTFVAPGHHADATTYRLLAARGVRTIGTHAAMTDSLARGQRNLGTSDDYGWQVTAATYAGKRMQVLQDARTRGRAAGLYTVLLHDPFTRPGYENGITMRWTGEVLDSLRREHRVRFLTMHEANAWLARPTGVTAASGVPGARALAVSVSPTLARGPVTVRVSGLTGTANVAAEVFDALGRRVARLHDGPAGSDTPSWTWDAAMPPGLYLVRVTMPGRAATARVVVAR